MWGPEIELIQIVSFADAISLKNLQSPKFRLKTFFFDGLKLPIPMIALS